MSRRLNYAGDPLSFEGDPLVFGPALPPAGLGPLANSHEADELEADIKAAFMQVFEYALRAKLARVERYGMPHRGDFETVERFVKAAGLALERRDNAEPYMRELFRAWTSHNPKRGLHFLRFYLRLLWPRAFRLTQLWHLPGDPYPAGCREEYTPGAFLTSRVRLFLDISGDVDGLALSKLVGSFRSVLPARLVLEVATTNDFAAGVRAALVAEADESQTFEVAANT
jgi:hypothetical protein